MHSILVTKDMLTAETLPAYGNTRYQTPHINAFARQGTVFTQCSTPCPSSAMSYCCIMVDRQPYELDGPSVEPHADNASPDSVFTAFEERGYDSFVVWDKKWPQPGSGSMDRLPIYGRKTRFYNLDFYNQIGIHRGASVEGQGWPDADVPAPSEQIIGTLKEITTQSQQTFTWLHCPHILAGYSSIGSDIGYFDKIFGDIVALYGSDQIFLSSDHGHMDFLRGEILFGKTMNQRVLNVPLITPRIPGLGPVEDRPFSNVRLKTLIADRRAVFDPEIYAVNQFPAQPERIITIRTGRYKYWYFKKYGSEALYDLDFDPLEDRNLLLELVYSRAKKRSIAMLNAIDYPAWDEAEAAYEQLRAAKEQVWSDPGFFRNGASWLKNIARYGAWNCFRDRFFPQTTMPGRWGSKAASQHFYL